MVDLIFSFQKINPRKKTSISIIIVGISLGKMLMPLQAKRILKIIKSALLNTGRGLNYIYIHAIRNKVRVTFHTNSNSGITQRKMTLCGVKGTIVGSSHYINELILFS